MEIIAITTCVNYSDILEVMIPQNAKFFKKWYIVTSPEDTDTAKLITDTNASNIEMIVYDGFYKEATFNFGGSRLYGQEHVDKHHESANILFLDADIYLPDNFTEMLPPTIEDDTVYGVTNRTDYWTLDDFNNETNPYVYPLQLHIVGFFQLYKQCKHKYQQSYNCSACDLEFISKFNNKINLKLSLKHLGRDGVNWDGRKKKPSSQ